MMSEESNPRLGGVSCIQIQARRSTDATILN